MVQNMSDEEDDTWGKWTAQGKSQQAPLQAPTTCLRRAESDSQERSNRIARRIQILLNSKYKCVSQARCQAKAMIVSKKWLKKIELDKIKAECKDKCCNPASSSAIRGSTNTTISEAATEHSEIRRLLNLADGNSKSSEAATEHSEIRRLLNLADEIPVATTVPTPTLLLSNDEQEPAPAPPPEQPPNAADAVCTAATRKRTDSESSLTDDDYESWLQSHGYST